LSTYNNIVLTARGNEINHAVQYLNLTDNATIDKFIELMAMMDNSNITLFYGDYYVQPVIGR
jgi:DNA-binding protein